MMRHRNGVRDAFPPTRRPRAALVDLPTPVTSLATLAPGRPPPARRPRLLLRHRLGAPNRGAVARLAGTLPLAGDVLAAAPRLDESRRLAEGLGARAHPLGP